MREKLTSKDNSVANCSVFWPHDEAMTEQTFSSVWDAIEDTPQQAASMRAKSELMQALE